MGRPACGCVEMMTPGGIRVAVITPRAIGAIGTVKVMDLSISAPPVISISPAPVIAVATRMEVSSIGTCRIGISMIIVIRGMVRGVPGTAA